MFYLLHGSDEFGIAQVVGRMRASLEADDPMATFNFNDLDGRKLTLGELRSAAESLPFMGERRLVVVSNFASRLNPRGGDKSGRKELAATLIEVLPQLPESTRLVFVDGKLHANNPLLKWAKTWLSKQPDPNSAAVIREFAPPKPADLPRWLESLAARSGGDIDSRAAFALGESLIRDKQVDLRVAASELEKLLTYADDRSVNVDDVAELVTSISLDSIFAFIDALANRDGPKASSMLHRFVDAGEAPLRILALIVRQFRLLYLARVMLDEGRPASEMQAQLPVPAFVVRKLSSQSKRFSAAFLVAALRRLLAIDLEIKTGQIDRLLALDLFVAGVCNSRPPRR